MSSSLPPEVDVVIVNWNSGTQLRACLESISAHGPSLGRLGKVMVIDNASTDRSLDAVSGPDLPLVVARNSENRGFGAACNQGANLGLGDFLLFLNPDARLTPGALDAALQFLHVRPQAAICGIALEREDGSVQRSCCRLPSARSVVVKSLGMDRFTRGLVPSYPMEEWAHDETRQVGHVIGAFYLVRRTVFDALSGFDERFFVYLEDLDFSTRAAALGWESWFLAVPHAFHRGGGTSEQAKSARLFYALRSRLQYSSKHFSRFGAAAVLVSTLFAEPIARTADALFHRSWGQFSDTLRAYRSLWGWAITHKRLRG